MLFHSPGSCRRDAGRRHLCRRLQRRLRTPRIIRHPVHPPRRTVFRRILGAAYGRAYGSCRAPRRRRIAASRRRRHARCERRRDRNRADVRRLRQNRRLCAGVSRHQHRPLVGKASIRVADHRRTRDTDGIRAHRGHRLKRSDPDHRRGRNRHCPGRCAASAA
ncbi:hypothetical protein NCGM2209_0503 [Mycobacterium tuberculosis NCGM2209]|nr:hypothetical protein NCGM2209_0503 [Mycobacterium tuberculosis NCGM2209]